MNKKFLKRIRKKLVKKDRKRVGVFFLLFLFLAFVALYLFKEAPKVDDFLQRRRVERVADACKGLEDPKLTSCRIRVLEEAVEKDGLDAGFEVLSVFFENNPVFASECHDFTHILGEKAYELFSKGEDFEVSAKASYCAYGFYHGFMDLLVVKEGDLKVARDFCAHIADKLGQRAYLACFHGIGHGWTDEQEEKHRGDEVAIAEPALDLCEKVSETDHELEICATGVFDSISIGYYNQAYGLQIKEDDPFWLCRQVDEKFKKPCYMDLMPAILWLGDYQLDESLFYMRYVEEEYLPLSIEILAENSVRYILKRQESPKEAVRVCRTLDGNFEERCVVGIASGLMQFGIPEREYVKAVEFCKLDTLTDKEEEQCLEKIVQYSKVLYSGEKLATEVCREFSGERREFCLNGEQEK